MDIKALIKAALLTPVEDGRWGLPMIYEGSPGTAKTSIVRQVAREIGLPCETIIASLREPTDFVGFPMLGQGGKLRRAVEGWVDRSAERPCVIFFDEINSAPPAVQKALLRVTQERVVGDVALHEGARMIAAQNPSDEVSGVWDLDSALANRFGHVAWQCPTVDEWTPWLLGGSGTTKAGTIEDHEDAVLAAWPDAFARSRGAIAGFLRARPGLLLKMPEANDPQASKGWPSPRSWSNASRAMASADVHGLDEETRGAFVAAFVGAAAEIELAAWQVQADLPDPADVLDGRVIFAPDPHRLDRTMAVVSGCAALVTPKSAAKRDERAAACWALCGRIADAAADVAVAGVEALTRAGLSTTPEARPVLAKVHSVYFAGAGR